MASFHLFGEDELCWGRANHHLEIIFGDRKLFSSRRWRSHSDCGSETLGWSKQPCQRETVIRWHPGDCVRRLTFGIGERAVTPASMGPVLLGQDSPSFMSGWCSGWTDGRKWSRIQKHLLPHSCYLIAQRTQCQETEHLTLMFQKSGSFLILCCKALSGPWTLLVGSHMPCVFPSPRSQP